MQDGIEARYLAIEWEDRGHARRIEVAPGPIEVHHAPDGTMVVETVMFNDVRPWLGLRLTGEIARERPAFVMADGEQRPMLAIGGEQGGTWWVQDDGWDAERRRHLSELHRSPGRFEVRIGSRSLFVDNDAAGPGLARLEEYLQDLQGDLFWLVMGFGGSTVARSAPSAGTGLAHAMLQLAAAARKVLRKPALALREVAAEARVARVRPNATTFRQHARMPTALRLVGRGTTETPDIAENRYVRHMVQHSGRLARTVLQSARRQAEAFEGRAAMEAGRRTQYRGMTYLSVHPDKFDRQLADLAKKLEPLSSYTDGPLEDHGRVLSYVVRIKGPFIDNSGMLRFDDLAEDWREREFQGIEYDVLKIPEALAKLLLQLLPFGKDHTVSGVAEVSRERRGQGKTYRLVAFSHVVSVAPHVLHARRRRRKLLEQQGWRLLLGRRDLDQVRGEARTAESRGRIYREQARRADEAAARLAAAGMKLQWLDRAWEAISVRPQSVVPTGMIFSRNPDYAACLSAFLSVREMAEQSGLDTATLDAVERIGVLQASALYERWCLVKIIAVLVEDYHFVPPVGWHECLIRAVTGIQEHDLTLQFVRKEDQHVAALEVQPVLANGKRPDFRLTFHRRSSRSKRGGLVMDAKFRTRWREGELSSTLDGLIRTKGYDQDGSRVFILHPVPCAMTEGSSPLDWGQDCDYGHDLERAHSQGAIYLAPGSDKSNPAANLRRLIALELQATFPAPSRMEPDSNRWGSDSFCIRCGRQHNPADIEVDLTEAGKPFWRLHCPSCEMVTIRTHCWACGRPLFKNGLQMTYHRTAADQITNVICPSCDQGL